MLQLLLALSFASGMCGIAYEILYARLLTTYLGDMYFVSAAILATFLLGIALGSLLARRWVRWLWAIEFLIGLYAATLAVAFSRHGSSLFGWLYPLIGGRPLALILAVFAFLIVPATLVGTSVPLFATYCRGYDREGRGETWFEGVYGMYNLGAAFCVLLIEFVLLRSLGIRFTLLAIASVNLVSACVLVRIRPPSALARDDFDLSALRSPALALFITSIASGVFQMVFLKIVEVFFGPYHENFAISVALALLGIALGTWVIGRVDWSFQGLLARGWVALTAGFLLFFPVVRLWGHVNALANDLELPTTLGKVLCLTLLGLVPFSVFGSTLPSLVKETQADRKGVGYLLCISSVGNGIGYLAAAFCVYQSLSFLAIALLLCASFLISGMLAGPPNQLWRMRRTALLGGAATLLLLSTWSERWFSLDYHAFLSPTALREIVESIDTTELIKRFDNHISLVTTKDGVEILNINGYRSLMADRGRTIPAEIVYGSVPAVYAPRRNSALVLGVGVGMTAGAAALLYHQLTAVEINPAMLEMLPRWSVHNLGLHQRSNVRMVLDDGISFLARGGERYDAIINTVTTPLFFSSSKLYTRDFFELVKTRLAPDGVYSMWFDERATSQGARIIFATLAASFHECVIVHLRGGYSQVICSQQAMVPHPLAEDEWPAEIRAKLAANFLTPMSALIAAIVLPTHHLFDTDWDAPINTLDRPVLEYTMAAVALKIVHERFQGYAMLRPDFRKSYAQDGRLNDDALAERCARLRALGQGAPLACLDELGVKDPAEAPYAYVRPVLDSLRGTAIPERVLLVHRLLDLGRAQEALEELDDMDRHASPTPTRRLLRVWAELDRAQGVSDEQLADLIRLDPLSPAPRRMLVAVLMQRKQLGLALHHLAILERMNALTERDREVEAMLRSGLGIDKP